MSRLKAFDKKFGLGFIRTLPAQAAVYRIFDNENSLIYVGKAKNLRRRIQQYRNAKRRRKHFKMKAIVEAAVRIDYIPCPSELEALLLETRMIQEHRPRFNVEGAFYFLYPMIGLRRDSTGLHFCFTTVPDEAAGFNLHGAYRSRQFTGDAFFALMKLLARVGHRIPSKRVATQKRRTYIFGFRRLPETWDPLWESFLQGESKSALEVLILSLIEDAGARKDSSSIQELIDSIARFFRHEALVLRRARRTTGTAAYPIEQRERDFLFLRMRHSIKEKRNNPTKSEAPCAPLFNV